MCIRDRSTPADVMVLDYSLPDVNGAKVASQLRRDGSTLRVVILTVHDNVHYVLRAMDAGADAFVVKSDSVEELLRAIRRVHVGGSYVSPRLAEKVEHLSLIHISEPTRLLSISYAVFCL